MESLVYEKEIAGEIAAAILKIGKVASLYQSKIDALREELQRAKATPPVSGKDQEYRIEHSFVGSSPNAGAVIIKAASEAAAVTKFFESRCSARISSVSTMPDTERLRSDLLKAVEELAEAKRKTTA